MWEGWSYVARADESGAAAAPSTNASDGESESSAEDNRRIEENDSGAATIPEVDKRPNKSRTGKSAITIQQNDNGLFRLEVQGAGAISGDGSVSLELDLALVEQLGRDVKESIREARLVGKDFVDGIKALSETIRLANESLKLLSQPETQAALRQAETLLRLLPKAAAPVEDVDQR